MTKREPVVRLAPSSIILLPHAPLFTPRVQKIMIKVRRRQPDVKEKCVNLQL